MKNILAALILITLPASRALAGAGCQTTTGGSGIVLEKIRQNATGPELFGCINRSFDVLASSGVPTRSTNSWLVEGRIDVSTIGATTNVPAVYFSSAVTVSSTLTVQGNTFSVGGSSFTVTGGTVAVAYRLTAGSLGLGGAPSGTRKFQVYFNANNNSPSYGDGAVRYLDSVNGVGFECGALYGGSQPSWCQSGNDGMGTKKPFVFQPDGSNVGIRTLSPATTAALEVAGPVSVGGSGNTQYSLQASSGASFGSDLHVTGTLEATKLKGDGSQITGIGGGGTVTTQGSPAAGQVVVFANSGGTIISTGTPSMTLGAAGSTTAISGAMTIGPSVYSTTASYISVLNGGCAAVVASSFTAVSVVYITGLSSAAYHHQYEFWGTKATAGHINARFNSDSGSNVVFINRGNNSANGGPLGWVSAGQADFPITECNAAASIADASDFSTTGDIFANPPKNNHLNFFGKGRYLYGARSTSDVTCYGMGGDYFGAAPLTTLTLTASAGTFSGYLTIKACPSGLVP
jgi:hypothetical protein